MNAKQEEHEPVRCHFAMANKEIYPYDFPHFPKVKNKTVRMMCFTAETHRKVRYIMINIPQSHTFTK